ncbi:hypothetical protein PV08_07038 [Exophiala spinifera]|uniref:Uncharacterized protein n=1 Tax=Exophiala spinifera TaxID=91928 RepID=A0A0D1YH00_9EURO|nr:uncharacterized protein PV08_07038 [Exophiala spinifera]KIW14256.1 hypothetical protein PV08_07038 [Exophiala spinifera]
MSIDFVMDEPLMRKPAPGSAKGPATGPAPEPELEEACNNKKPTTGKFSAPVSLDPDGLSARPPYTQEMNYFIWYHRIDRGLSWDTVTYKFNRYFDENRPKIGLQCRFYRLLAQNKVAPVRRQLDSPPYGQVTRLLDFTELRFPWMRRAHRKRRGVPQRRTCAVVSDRGD